MKKTGNPKRKPRKPRKRHFSEKRKVYDSRRKHCLQRLDERYGMVARDMDSIIRKRTYGLTRVVKKNRKAQIEKIFYNNMWVYFVWNNTKNQMSTFLKKDWCESLKVHDFISGH